MYWAFTAHFSSDTSSASQFGLNFKCSVATVLSSYVGEQEFFLVCLSLLHSTPHLFHNLLEVLNYSVSQDTDIHPHCTFHTLPRCQTDRWWLWSPNRPPPTTSLPLPASPGRPSADMVRTRKAAWAAQRGVFCDRPGTTHCPPSDSRKPLLLPTSSQRPLLICFPPP